MENSFTSIADLARLIVKAPPWIPDRLFCGAGGSFRSSARVRGVESIPMLFFSGSLDDVVPPSMMRRLFEACPARAKRLVTFPTGGHVDTWMAGGYVEAWRTFAKEVFGFKFPLGEMTDVLVDVDENLNESR